MAINREAIRKQIEDAKKRRSGGFVQFLNKTGPTLLRILPFNDADGNEQFARTVAHYRYAGEGNKEILDRQGTFGATCAASIIHNSAKDDGGESPFQRRQISYYVNAYDTSKQGSPIKIYKLPTTVFEAIAAMLVSDEWADVLDPAAGHGFTIMKTGSGLDTVYDVVVSRAPVPVDAKRLEQVKDPYTAVKDPGLKGQCEAMGVEFDQLFPDIEGLELVDPIVFEDTAAATAPAAAPAKSPVAAAAAKVAAKAGAVAPKPVVGRATVIKPKEPAHEFVAGTKVTAAIEGATWTGIIASIEGGEATIDFEEDTDNQYSVPVASLTWVADPEAGGEVEGGGAGEDLPSIGLHGMAPFEGAEGVFACTVSSHEEDGTLGLAYDDGDTGFCAPADFIPDEAAPEPAPKATPKPTAAPKSTAGVPAGKKPAPAAAAAAKAAAARLTAKKK